MMAWTDHHFRQLVRLIERQWRVDYVNGRGNDRGVSVDEHVACVSCHGQCGVLLVTEMLEADRVRSFSIDRPDGVQRLMAFHAAQMPIAAQIGGSDPEVLADAAKRCASAGYAEVRTFRWF